MRCQTIVRLIAGIDRVLRHDQRNLSHLSPTPSQPGALLGRVHRGRAPAHLVRVHDGRLVGGALQQDADPAWQALPTAAAAALQVCQ